LDYFARKYWTKPLIFELKSFIMTILADNSFVMTILQDKKCASYRNKGLSKSEVEGGYPPLISVKNLRTGALTRHNSELKLPK
jgi:hypothetical protein